MTDGGRLSPAAVGRSAAAAGGAVTGFVLAIPLGVYLVILLFWKVGTPLLNAILHGDLTPGVSGLRAFILGTILVIVAFVTVLCLVLALAAPIFLLVPLLASATALRLTRAGAITRTLWLTLALVLALASAVLLTLWTLNADPEWWMWPLVVGVGAFLARLTIELTRPAQSHRPSTTPALGPRWKHLTIAWLTLLAVGVIGGVALFLATLNVATSG